MCGNNDDLYQNIYDHLVNNSNDIKLNKDNDSLIGANLEKIMNTFDISNVMISKYLNKDGSLISKYKVGKRYILKNDKLVIQICDYFADYIIKNNLQEDAYSLFNISETDNLKDAIFNFLFTKQKENSQINSLLESINDFKFDISQNIPSIESLVPSEIINSKNDYYIGTNEFRNAIKRFLGSICLRDNPTTLYLYSNESMKWLFQNKAFYNAWKMLMINCLIKKNSIKIIHNINRNTNEMFKAIESWLPLYMTGLIEPYYNIKNTNGTFNHTLFIAEKLSVISSSSIICNKDCNVYNYFENKDVIHNYKNQFLSLLNNANNLVKIYIKDNIKNKEINDEEYITSTPNNFNNISIKLKKGESEVLIIKTDFPNIIFEFTYPKMVEIFSKYINSN